MILFDGSRLAMNAPNLNHIALIPDSCIVNTWIVWPLDKYTVSSQSHAECNLPDDLPQLSLVRSIHLFSRQPFHHLLRLKHLPKPIPKPIQSRLMLLLTRRPASILDKPRLKSPVERTPGRGITAAIRHDPTYHHSLSSLLFKHRSEVGVDEGVVGVLVDDGVFIFGSERVDVGHQLPVFGAFGDGAGRTPFADKLVFEGGCELGLRVAVLGEDAGERVRFEVGGEAEDVGEAGGCHGGEDILHVYYQEGGGHFGGGWRNGHSVRF